MPNSSPLTLRQNEDLSKRVRRKNSVSKHRRRKSESLLKRNNSKDSDGPQGLDLPSKKSSLDSDALGMLYMQSRVLEEVLNVKISENQLQIITEQSEKIVADDDLKEDDLT